MGNLLQDNHRILFIKKKRKKDQLSAAFKLVHFIFDVHRVPIQSFQIP